MAISKMRVKLPAGITTTWGYKFVKGNEGLPVEIYAEGEGVDEGVSLSLNAGSVDEDAGATSITVTGTLNESARTTDTTVTVTVGESDDAATEGTDYATVADLTLTIDSGETSGTASFTLTPSDDDVDEDDETLSVTGSNSDLSVAGTTATIVDDDVRGVEVSATTLTVPEDGTATYTVVLESQPTATVTVTPTVSGDTDVTVSPTSLSFSTGDWQTAKTLMVSAAQDDDTDDDTATISHAVAGGDYASVTASDVGVTVTDDDTAEPETDQPAVTVVPSVWPLIPVGLGSGDEFRLLAKTKNPLKPKSTSADIADYNDYAQEQIRGPGATPPSRHTPTASSSWARRRRSTPAPTPTRQVAAGCRSIGSMGQRSPTTTTISTTAHGATRTVDAAWRGT